MQCSVTCHGISWLEDAEPSTQRNSCRVLRARIGAKFSEGHSGRNFPRRSTPDASLQTGGPHFAHRCPGRAVCQAGCLSTTDGPSVRKDDQMYFGRLVAKLGIHFNGAPNCRRSRDLHRRGNVRQERLAEWSAQMSPPLGSLEKTVDSDLYRPLPRHETESLSQRTRHRSVSE